MSCAARCWRLTGVCCVPLWCAYERLNDQEKKKKKRPLVLFPSPGLHNSCFVLQNNLPSVSPSCPQEPGRSVTTWLITQDSVFVAILSSALLPLFILPA